MGEGKLSFEDLQAIYEQILQKHWTLSTGTLMTSPGAEDRRLAAPNSNFPTANPVVLRVKPGV